MIPSLYNDDRLLILLFLEAKSKGEEELLTSSIQILNMLFKDNSIHQVVLFWREGLSTKLMVGIDENNYQNYLKSNHDKTFLSRTSFLYKYEP